MQNFDNEGASDSRSDGDRNTKKDKLLGGGAVIFGMACNDPSEGSESDFELLEGDVSTTMVNGIPAIVFSDSI
ncbi:hypothetical protein Goklo_026673 [Gossypium klotzschianum]|uniref:Uncharacterized protein n=1 Tax=Gossypium klotzschianum TaxID=34286 RepID=A0A7J8TVR6_9ROSI|nr:hypothetical protein [Gossypium klotzschianum]